MREHRRSPSGPVGQARQAASEPCCSDPDADCSVSCKGGVGSPRTGPGTGAEHENRPLALYGRRLRLGFATYRGLTAELNDEFRSFGLFYDVAMGVALGLIVTGGVALALRRLRGELAVLSQPGHWLIAFALAAALAAGLADAAYYARPLLRGPRSATTVQPPYWVPFELAWAPNEPMMIHQAVGWGLACTASLAFCGAFFHRLRWHWWALFLVSALGSLYLFGGHTALLIHPLGAATAISWCKHAAQVYAKLVALCFLLLLYAVTRDFGQGRRGDGLHWIGVSAWIVILMMQLALYIWFWPMPLRESLRLLFTL